MTATPWLYTDMTTKPLPLNNLLRVGIVKKKSSNPTCTHSAPSLSTIEINSSKIKIAGVLPDAFLIMLIISDLHNFLTILFAINGVRVTDLVFLKVDIQENQLL